MELNYFEMLLHGYIILVGIIVFATLIAFLLTFLIYVSNFIKKHKYLLLFFKMIGWILFISVLAFGVGCISYIVFGY